MRCSIERTAPGLSAAHRRLAWLSTLLMALALGASTPAAADWGTDYLRALRAFDQGSYQEALQLLESAQARRATPSARERLDARTLRPYLPQLYRGLAHARLGECSEALPLLQDSRTLAVLPRLPEEAGLQARALQGCEAALAAARPPEPPPAPVDPWERDRPVVRDLIALYLADQLSADRLDTAAPATDRGRQWVLLLQTLKALREAEVGQGEPAIEARRRALGHYAEAQALGPLPSGWEVLLPPSLRARLGQE